jgi:archaemetzincin
VDPQFAFHPERQQYHSTEILAWMHRTAGRDTWRLLGVTALDLYIPILTFVFGEAQLGNTCAVVSSHRLRQEFYGLPPDDDLLRERVLKEAIHELGHTLGLTHCENYSCAMAPSHAVEWIDLKSKTFCLQCRACALSREPRPVSPSG